jgi:hypothetical protein
MKRFLLSVLKVFGVCLLVPLAVWFWPQTLEILKRQRQRKFYDRLYGRKRRRRFPLPSDKEKMRMRRLWDEYFEIQKQRFYQRQEELREEFSKEIARMREQNQK